jgi:hypothetical protein
LAAKKRAALEQLHEERVFGSAAVSTVSLKKTPKKSLPLRSSWLCGTVVADRPQTLEKNWTMNSKLSSFPRLQP